MRRSRLLVGFVLLTVILMFGVASCGDDDADDGDLPPTATTEATVADVDDATPTAPPDFAGSRDPVEIPGDGEPGAQLTDVRTARHEGFDRVVFEYEVALPGTRVEYVSPPVAACGSGLPVDVAGDAFLRVRMFPAAAHDDAGETTFNPQEVSPGLQSILVVALTCDFEGEVTWVVSLSSEADFTAMKLTEPFRIVVDVAHP